MSIRGRVWIFGLIGLGVMLAAVQVIDSSATATALVLSLTLVLCGLGVETLQVLDVRNRPAPPKVPQGARPADGIIEQIAMEGVDGEPNPIAPQWQRFLRCQPLLPSSDSVSRSVRPIQPPLLGSVALISVFVGRDGQDWSDSEVARAHESLERAGIWIEMQARSRGVPVNLALASTYFLDHENEDDWVEVAFGPEGNEIGPMEAQASQKALRVATRAAARLGFADVVAWYHQVEARTRSDTWVWLFHVRRAGRSLAIPAAESDLEGIGLAVCYAREACFPEPWQKGAARVDPTTVAHELLHLFGASDKYGVPLRSFADGQVSSRDVMRLHHRNLSRMSIDDLTAREIGWNLANLDPWREATNRPPPP